jgi:hypothetical protein
VKSYVRVSAAAKDDSRRVAGRRKLDKERAMVAVVLTLRFEWVGSRDKC